MSTATLVHGLRDKWLKSQEHEIDSVLAACESPIEQLFLSAGLVGWWGRINWYQEWMGAHTRYKSLGVSQTSAFFHGETPGNCVSYVVAMQACVDGASKYRIDFAFTSEAGNVAVELDGHDFHEKTKEQARRDKSKDRYLTERGWRPVRFTGSEVYANAGGCVENVHAIIDAMFLEREALWAKARSSEGLGT